MLLFCPSCSENANKLFSNLFFVCVCSMAGVRGDANVPDPSSTQFQIFHVQAGKRLSYWLRVECLSAAAH